MAWTVPSPSDISAKLRGTLRRYLPGTDALIWPNNLTAIVKTAASGLHDVHLRAAWLYDQVFATSATVQHLERHAAEYGLYRRSASRASGEVELPAVAGTIYPAGIRFTGDAGLYRSVGEARAAGNNTVRFLVVSEALGTTANLDAGSTLSRADPGSYLGLGQTATVLPGGIGGGAEREEDEALRARVLDRKRRPPQGASEADYEQWALAVPGVVKAWSFRFSHGAGTVGTWFLFAGRPNLIPIPADVEAVQDALDRRRIIRSEHHAVAPRPAPLDVTIAGLATDTVGVRAAVEAGLRAMLFERAWPGLRDRPFVLSRSWVGEAVSAAVGEQRHVLIEPATDVQYEDGRYPVLGLVTFA